MNQFRFYYNIFDNIYITFFKHKKPNKPLTHRSLENMPVFC